MRFDDRKSTNTVTLDGPKFTPNTIGNSETVTTTITHSTMGVTDGQINDFVISEGITMDGKHVSSADFDLTSSHEFGHSGGLNHPWSLKGVEKSLLPKLNQGTGSADKVAIKNNLLNSGENPDSSLRNNSGGNLTLEQLNVVSQKVHDQGHFKPEELKK